MTHVDIETIGEGSRSTDYVKILVPGVSGRTEGGKAPTLGIIGSLGGVGARPERIGMVSDADGAIAALACAARLGLMAQRGDRLPGDVRVITHICPHAPTRAREPVPLMDAPLPSSLMSEQEADPAMDAVLSVDATKSNRILNHCGIAITPTVKAGYILRVSESLLDILSWTTGAAPQVLPITMQDITPYENGLYHMNSIMQPCIGTDAPVVGVATTADAMPPGCATGANQETDIAMAARFCSEVAKAFTSDRCSFFDEEEFARMVSMYGSMKGLQTPGMSR